MVKQDQNSSSPLEQAKQPSSSNDTKNVSKQNTQKSTKPNQQNNLQETKNQEDKKSRVWKGEEEFYDFDRNEGQGHSQKS